MNLSKNFLALIGRLSLAGIIILGGLNFGSTFYASGVIRESNKMLAKTPSRQVNAARNTGLKISIEGNDIFATPETINNLLEPYIRDYSGKKNIRVSPDKVESYLNSISPSVYVQPVNARLIIVDGKAENISPSEYGRELDMELSKKLLTDAIVSNKSEIRLITKTVEPAVTLERANELGIATLIGHGESDFKGSSQARINNIKSGTNKYNGLIIGPGEEFSFNSFLGEISEEEGFQSELVIKSGKLVRELGGGLCQVSTTLFRAAVMAGLPIIERKPHSFPVKYYSPQGFDATVYPGVVDMKFRNDTSSYILIQSKMEGTKLTFDIYGTDGGRKITLDGPHQYDQKFNGSMRAYFIRQIKFADGSVKEERFDSNYGAPFPLERNALE